MELILNIRGGSIIIHVYLLKGSNRKYPHNGITTVIERTHVELDISAPSATSMDGAMLDQPVIGNALDHGEGG